MALIGAVSAGAVFFGWEVDDVAAHPGHDHGDVGSTAAARIWKDASGAFELHASFVAVVEKQARLLKTDGTLLNVPLDRLSTPDQRWVTERQAEIRLLNTQPFAGNRPPVLVAAEDDEEKEEAKPAELAANNPPASTRNAAEPAIHSHFRPFADSLKLRWDADYYYVGSNGMPAHPMMTGIRAWQQQVPLPQKYYDDNAWRIPLHPVPAKEPAMIKGRFLRGAIALAVNGIPIFNPQNNRGDVSYEIGELDEYGGHCGRADDYHYHLAPVHLEKVIGKDRPIAYTLDGYPIYGYQDEKASDFAPLDRLSGRKDQDGNYRYHATKNYPYVIGGFYGEVVERDGQVDPQPRAQPVREALPQLPGAKITDFKSTGPGGYELTYDVDGKSGYVRYTIAASGAVEFTYVDTTGKTTTETATPGRRPGGGGGPRPGGPGGPGGKRPPPRSGENPSPRDPNRTPREGTNPPPPPGEEGAATGKPRGPQSAAADGQRGPAPGSARKPWIAEHFTELDADQDQVLTRQEMLAEAERTVTAYDTDGDGKLLKSEYDRGGVKSAFAGFVRGHAVEVDADGDEVITKREVLDFAGKLFEKSDRDGDGRATLSDASAQGPAKRGEEGPGKSTPKPR
jgi:hypothetical protein